mmetsp:Transcript_24461/g.36687  ORF Transcript_24461/g.36687 Transcript_24461/m.36687 type:complete len:624 (-) Transcript_24461:114-1985(-)
MGALFCLCRPQIERKGGESEKNYDSMGDTRKRPRAEDSKDDEKTKRPVSEKAQFDRLETISKKPQFERLDTAGAMEMLPTKAEDIKIKLLPLEEKIFNTIKDMLVELKSDTEVRVAGGWVRDKCLGKESDDIDFSVDKMNGEQFAKAMQEYIEKKTGEKARGVGVIQKNPEKSKHLETCTFTIFGINVDVNNLRTEVYPEGSRIPVCKIGTAEQDSLRRDFTCNALFYNINTGKVEDFTGKGLTDLKNGILRTPLDPAKTFKDDPLRILRAVRFAARFSFILDSDIRKAAKIPAIRVQLEQKVSRERFGIELNKVVGGVGNPAEAFQYLIDFNLEDVVFQEPPKGLLLEDPEVKYRQLNPQKLLRSSGIKTMENMHKFLKGSPKATRTVALYAAFLSPYHGYAVKVKKRLVPAVQWILRESIKTADGAVAAVAARILNAAIHFYHLVSLHSKGIEKPEELKILRRRTGSTLLEVKDDYKTALGLCRAIRKAGVDLNIEEKKGESKVTVMMEVEGKMLMDIEMDVYEKWLENSSKLNECWKWKPLVGSKDLMSLLDIRGPAIGEMTRRLVVWRLQNPEAKKEEAEKFLLASVKEDPPKMPPKTNKSSSKKSKKKGKKDKKKRKK